MERINGVDRNSPFARASLATASNDMYSGGKFESDRRVNGETGKELERGQIPKKAIASRFAIDKQAERIN